MPKTVETRTVYVQVGRGRFVPCIAVLRDSVIGQALEGRVALCWAGPMDEAHRLRLPSYHLIPAVRIGDRWIREGDPVYTWDGPKCAAGHVQVS
jgi:hypothetical protein